MKKKSIVALIMLLALTLFTACGSPCKDTGHAWLDATCDNPRTCSVCGAQEGAPLGHKFTITANCTTAEKCSVCGKTHGVALGHSYDNKGVCEVCGETKEFQNSYGYFSRDDLLGMAKDAVSDYCYPAYVNNYSSSSEVMIEKVTDSKLQYGTDSFSVVGSAKVTSGEVSRGINFVAVIEPHLNHTYVSKDVYVVFK